MSFLVLFTGCATKVIDESTTTTEYADGKVAKVTTQTTITSEGTATSEKSLNVGSNVGGFKVTATDPGSGTMAPTVALVDGNVIYQSAKAFKSGESNPPQYMKMKRSNTVLNYLTLGTFGAESETTAYTGVAGETAAETTARVKAFNSDTSSK